MPGLKLMGYAASLTWLGALVGQSPAESTLHLGPSPTHGGHEARHRPSCSAHSRGKLLSAHSLYRYSATGLREYWDAWLHGVALGYIDDTVDPGIENGAETFLVKYCTVDFDGAPIVGSGLLAIPSVRQPAPNVMYSHGTAVTRFDTPSNPDVSFAFDGPSAMVIFAGHGYLFLAPDLTGFGASTAPRHRYLHAESEANSTLDMWVAVQQYRPYRARSNGRLFNSGYSAGAHTALAFAAQAEAAGVAIVATSVGGAVSNPEAWFTWLIEQVDSSYLQVYPADILISYSDVYGDVYRDPAAALTPPFDVTLAQLFDMNHTYDKVVAGLPGSTAGLVTSSFFREIHDPNSPIWSHLRANAADDVCLDHPIRMLHMIDDDEVPYEISVAALAHLSTCNEVELVDWIGKDHLNTWHETLPGVRAWFDSF